MNTDKKQNVKTALVTVAAGNADKIFKWLCSFAGANADVPKFVLDIYRGWSIVTSLPWFWLVRWGLILAVLAWLLGFMPTPKLSKQTESKLWIPEPDESRKRVRRILSGRWAFAVIGIAVLVAAIVGLAINTLSRPPLDISFISVSGSDGPSVEGATWEARVISRNQVKLTNHSDEGMSLSFIVMIDVILPNGEHTGMSSYVYWKGEHDDKFSEVVNVEPKSTAVGTLRAEIPKLAKPLNAEWIDMMRGRPVLRIEDRVSGKFILSGFEHYPPDVKLRGPHVTPP